VLAVLYEDAPFLLRELGITLMAAFGGYALALVLSVLITTLFVLVPVLERYLYPYVAALKITPVIALIPLFILWFGLGIISEVLVAALICFFPLLVNMLQGLKTIDREALRLFRSLGASKLQIFWKLRVPSALPYTFAGLKVTTVLALTGAFVAEFVAGTQGLGHVILTATRTFESDVVFAGIVMSIFGGLIFFAGVSLLERKVIFWQKID